VRWHTTELGLTRKQYPRARPVTERFCSVRAFGVVIVAIVLSVPFGGCSTRSNADASHPSAGNGGTSPGGRGSAGSGGVGGNATVHGTLGGRPFEMASSSWLIGAPDDPQQTRVIYVFDKPVTCSEISMAGWDTAITDATQALEIKLIGTKPGKYPVATSAQPATGEASVNYTLSAMTGTPAETVSKSGSVTLDAITDGTSANGSFDLSFPNGSVTGTFDAAYCPNGHEP
jgi:hypothetical protein